MNSSRNKPPKKTQKRLHRPKVSKDKVNDDDYVQMEVRGDGNCFYYSVYGAAKYHANPFVFGKLLSCFEIKDKPTSLTPQEFAKKVRIKLAEEIQKPVGIMEAQEAVAVELHRPLEYQAQKNENLFTMMHEASKRVWAPTETSEYRDLVRMQEKSERDLEQATTRSRTAGAAGAAKIAANKDVEKFTEEVRQAKENIANILKPASGRAHWDAILQEVSREFGRHPLLGKARAYETMTKQQFKDAFVKILAGDALDGNSFMYASQPDVEILQFFLSKCETPLKIFPINPNRDIIISSSNDIPVLNVVLLFRGGYEHYNYYVRGDKYKENIDKFEQPAVRVKKQHIGKGNTPNTNSNESLSSVSNSNSNESLPSVSNSNESLPSVSNSNSSASTTRKNKKSVTAIVANAKAATVPEMSAAFAMLEKMRAKKAAANAAKGSMTQLVRTTKPFHIGPLNPQKPYNHVINALATLPPLKPSGPAPAPAAAPKQNKAINKTNTIRTAKPTTPVQKGIIPSIKNAITRKRKDGKATKK